MRSYNEQHSRPKWVILTYGFAIGGFVGLVVGVLVLLGVLPEFLIFPTWIILEGILAAGRGGGLDYPASLLLCVLIIAIFYAGFGALVAAILSSTFRGRRFEIRTVPDCAICGFRWPVPTHSICPQCNTADAFAGWMDRTPSRIECSKCGYSLVGNESQRCPECGEAF